MLLDRLRKVVSTLAIFLAVCMQSAQSANSSQSEERYNQSTPAQSALILYPLRDSLVSGLVHITAAPADARVEVSRATFYFNTHGAEARHLIGVDSDGADELLNTFQPGPTGDGWSGYWQTAELPDGLYDLWVRLTTEKGSAWGSTTVYVQHVSPVPSIETPRFGNEVSGLVDIFADRGAGVRATFEVRPQLSTVTFPVDPTNQHNPHLPGNGAYYCDPASEAAILWKYKDIRDKVINEVRNSTCRGKTGAALESCAKEALVKGLGKYKHTTASGGTDYDNEKSGTEGLLHDRGFTDWGLQPSGNKGVVSFKQFKDFASGVGQRPGRVKGVLVHVHRKSNPDKTGHVMAVTSISDRQQNGKYEVKFMDPDSGREITIHVAPDGSFTYPEPNGQPSFISDMSRIVGPPSAAVVEIQNLVAARAIAYARVIEGRGRRKSAVAVGAGAGLSNDPPALVELPLNASIAPEVDRSVGWTVVGVDRGSKRAWHAVWNTRGFRSGYYWLRVTVTDQLGHIGWDVVEVRLR